MEYAYYNLINYDGSFFMCGEGMVLFVKLVIREVLCLFMSLKIIFSLLLFIYCMNNVSICMFECSFYY